MAASSGERHSIFVSHSNADNDFTMRLVADLTAAGADVWVDRQEITYDDFLKWINRGLAQAHWLVLVLTPDALRSEWVEMEVNAALNMVRQRRMRGVIPMLARSCDVAAIPPIWDTLQRYDATADYQGALADLLRVLGLSATAANQATTSTEDPPPPSRRGPDHQEADSGNAHPTSASPSEPRITSKWRRTGAPAVMPPAMPVELDRLFLPFERPPASPTIPPDRFPSRLAQLGYQGRILGDFEMILPLVCDVPAGAFLMGSDPAHDKQLFDNEKPQHWVTLPAFALARYPVTVAEYACFIHAGRKEPKDTYGDLEWQKQLKRPDHPVTFISWDDAVAYADWLTKHTGQSWRLPSEAEWEKAARWDPNTRTARLYPWGDTFDKKRCNTFESGKGTTIPVDSYPSGASPCGAQEMAGNVWEWTSSVLKSYPYSQSDGRIATNPTESRALRGGSWLNFARVARTACRFVYPPDFVSGFVGFRLVLATPAGG